MLLPVHPYDEPKHAVRGRVLRPHIDHQIDGVGMLCELFLKLHRCPNYRALSRKNLKFLVHRLTTRRNRETGNSFDPGTPRTRRTATRGSRSRMAVEDYTKQIVVLPLVPVGAAPDPRNRRRDRARPQGKRDLTTSLCRLPQRPQVVVDLQFARRLGVVHHAQGCGGSRSPGAGSVLAGADILPTT